MEISHKAQWERLVARTGGPWGRKGGRCYWWEGNGKCRPWGWISHGAGEHGSPDSEQTLEGEDCAMRPEVLG